MDKKCSRRRDTATAPAFGTECGQRFVLGERCEFILQGSMRKRNVQIAKFILFLSANTDCSVFQQMILFV